MNMTNSDERLLRGYIKEIARNKVENKLRIFDFDDTLVTTDSKVRVKTADGKTLVLTPGEYAVYAWWSSSGGRTTQAPYTIQHSGTPSTTTVTVNQHRDAGRWNLLGRFPFEATAVVSVESASSELSTVDRIAEISAPANTTYSAAGR